jgi:DNA topoisomerase I
MARAFDARERARLQRDRIRHERATQMVAESQISARQAGLVYVTDAEPGIQRRKAGAGFRYLDPKGKPVAPGEIARIRALAVPPAYTGVWICPHPRGHLQATGRDARKRKQYRYHAAWRDVRDSGKFERMADFGKRLPRLRARLRHDLALPGLPQVKVVALVVRLLSDTLLRIGNDVYARDNKSFGLTTLRDRHVAFEAGSARFQFRGKSGKTQEVAIDDPRLTRLVKRCQALPGQQLFQYLDEHGKAHGVDSGMVNDYLRDSMGAEFSAKDFRTWGATVAAVSALAARKIPERGGERAIAATQLDVVREVAAQLGNTPAVCRASYIHPASFACWRDGSLHKLIPAGARRSAANERRVVNLLLRHEQPGARAAPKR